MSNPSAIALPKTSLRPEPDLPPQMERWTPPKIAPVASGLGSYLVADLAGQLVEISAQGEVTVLYPGSLIE